MAILVVHGCADVQWQTHNQVLLYDIVGRTELESAVRPNAMARYLAVLAGPAVGGAFLLTFGSRGRAAGLAVETVAFGKTVI